MPTVLVVDDDAAIRTLLSALLHRRGIAADVAEDGEQAIAKLRRASYDALILDLMMPKVSGFDVIQYLRAERREMLPRTIVVTAAAERTLGHFDQDSIAAVLRKPFDIYELMLKLLACMDGHSKSER